MRRAETNWGHFEDKRGTLAFYSEYMKFKPTELDSFKHKEKKAKAMINISNNVISTQSVTRLAILALVLSIGFAACNLPSLAEQVPSSRTSQTTKNAKADALPSSDQESQYSKFASHEPHVQDGWEFYKMNASGSWDKTMRRFPPSYTVRTKHAGD